MKQLSVWAKIMFSFILIIVFVSYWYYSFKISGQSTKEVIPDTNLVKKKFLKLSSKISNRIWTVKPVGRLGNQIGQYATLYSLAKLNGHPAYIVPRMHETLSKLFKINLPMISQKVHNRIKWRQYPIKNWMCPEYKNISGQYVKLVGVPCSWTFHHHIWEEIHQEFTFHDFVKAEANAYLSNVKGNRENVTFVGVHVRRGDYVEIMPKKWKGVVADKGYLQKAMDYFRNKYENPLFIVTSNGMDWCKENINNSLEDVHLAGDGNEASPARDFALLTHCNHSIITIGTFGIWVAYLVGGETVHLSNFLLPNSPYFRYFKYETTYLPEWIGIPANLSSLLNKKT
ncbi:galactoside alpha-(1,2)-fucosyltransferase 2-like [Lithobates pipiens]